VDAAPSGYADRVFIGAEYTIVEGSTLVLGHEWMSGASTLVRRSVLGIHSQLFKNTYAFANYGMEDSIDAPRNTASFGIKNRFVINDRLSADLGLDSLYVINGSNNETFVAPALSVSYLADLSKHSMRLEARFGQTDIRYLIEAATARKVEANFSYMLKDTFALTTYNAGGCEYLHTLTSGVSYRPLFNDRVNLLGKLSFTDRQSKDNIRSIKLVNSVEANYQPVPPLTISGKYTVKWAYDSANSVLTSSFLDLYSIRVLYDVIKNVDFGFHFGVMPHWQDGSFDYYAGVETGYRLVKNVYASAGWNYRGLADPDMVENSYNSIGFFIGLRCKFDEGSFGLDK
jgi:hypothetical protein